MELICSYLCNNTIYKALIDMASDSNLKSRKEHLLINIIIIHDCFVLSQREAHQMEHIFLLPSFSQSYKRHCWEQILTDKDVQNTTAH